MICRVVRDIELLFVLSVISEDFFAEAFDRILERVRTSPDLRNREKSLGLLRNEQKELNRFPIRNKVAPQLKNSNYCSEKIMKSCVEFCSYRLIMPGCNFTSIAFDII